MPYTLSDEEKNRLREEYLKNVATINKYLSEESRVRPDLKTLNKRLNDPNEQRTYKKGLELNARERRRQEIYDNLADKYRHLKQPGKQYALNRLISYQFDMSDDPEAQAYNENVIKNYYLHPEAMAQRECKKIIKYNPQEALKISKSKDMEGFLMEYYERHAEEVENAFGLLGTTNNINRDEIKTPEAKQYLDGIAPSYEVLSTSSEVAKNMTDGFFTMPKLTMEQEEELFDSNFDRENAELNEELKRQKRMATFRSQSYKQYKDFFNKMEKMDKDLCTPGSFNKHLAKGQFNGKDKYYGITTVMDEELVKDAKIIKLDAKEAEKVEQLFTKDFAEEENFIQHDFIPSVKKSDEQVTKDFRYEYALRNNKSMVEMDKKDILSCLKDHKGGIWERWRGTTSQQYKAFERSVEDYYNISENHGNRDNVIKSATAYLTYKGIDLKGNVEEQIARLGTTARGRANFCLSTINALKQPEYRPENKLDYVQAKENTNEIKNAIEDEKVKENVIGSKQPAILDKEILEDKPKEKETVDVDVVVKQAEPVTETKLENDEPKL